MTREAIFNYYNELKKFNRTFSNECFHDFFCDFVTSKDLENNMSKLNTFDDLKHYFYFFARIYKINKRSKASKELNRDIDLSFDIAYEESDKEYLTGIEGIFTIEEIRKLINHANAIKRGGYSMKEFYKTHILNEVKSRTGCKRVEIATYLSKLP